MLSSETILEELNMVSLENLGNEESEKSNNNKELPIKTSTEEVRLLFMGKNEQQNMAKTANFSDSFGLSQI